jgi:Leucine-rich repeat (LRR) protein
MTRFLQSNRSDVGLADRFDLSEIYVQDSRFALSNMLLDPDGLDQIFGLSSDGLTREDVRTVGGLDRPVIHSLAISDEVLGGVSFDLSQKITADKAIGEPGKHSFNANSESDNIIVFSGGIAANKIEYNFLDETGELRTTTVPTSRESLFDSIKDDDGRFTTAFYSGLFRIRRRSHVNEIKLNRSLLVEKSLVVESPTDLLNLPIYMQTTNTPSPTPTLVGVYATKNSPLILPVRIASSASISFSRASANANSPAFVFGWELRRFSDGQLVRGQNTTSRGNITTVSISINVTGTIGAGADCLLYIYLDPSVITKADLSGIGLKEVLGGQDIGMVGFNNLEELDISNNSLSTLPVWLKTLYNKLKVLNIQGNSFWNNGIVSVFDYQDLSGAGITGANTSAAVPNVALSQVLGYSGWFNSGRIAGYLGNYATVQDTSGRIYKDSRARSIAGLTTTTTNIENGFRPFVQLTDLNLGSTVGLVNPDFSKIFPNLLNLTIDRPRNNAPQQLFGLIPKLMNNKGIMSIKLNGHEAQIGGSIKYMGDTLEWDSDGGGWDTNKSEQFIGQFNIKFIDFSRTVSSGTGYIGGICTDSSDVPNNTLDGSPRYHHITSGSVGDAWSGWANTLEDGDFSRNDIAFKITGVSWNSLRQVRTTFCGDSGVRNKVLYNGSVAQGTLSSSEDVNARSLRTINCWSAGWYGKIFSIKQAPLLRFLQIGRSDWEGYLSSDGREFLLPDNFVEPVTQTSSSGLEDLRIEQILGGINKNLELRSSDFLNLPKLNSFYISDSYIGGVFPTLPNNNLTSGVVFSCWLRNSRFRDLKALSSLRVRSIFAPLQGAGVGGTLLPVFSATSNATLNYVNFNSSLSSSYPAGWGVVGDRNKLITPLAPGQLSQSTTPGVLWTSRNNNNTANANSDKLYHNSLGTFFPSTEILVGDEVLISGAVVGRVTQIGLNNEFIYIDTQRSVVSESITFRRRGQDISTYFTNHSNLTQLYLSNCRLVGNMPRFIGCTNLAIVDLSNNLLSGYEAGTFENITGASIQANIAPRLRSFSAFGNAFTVSAIRSMISDLHKVAVYFSSKNIRINLTVRLLSTKLNTTTKQYQNWTRSEIFNQTSTSGDGNTVPDSLETQFNQLGPGSLYPGIRIELF